MSKDIEINFAKGFENKEEAKKVVKQIQDSIDELVLANTELKAQLNYNLEVIKSAEEQITNLTDTSVGLSDALKAVHRILQARKDQFKGDDEMKAVMDSLATFVVSSGAIKLGVISHAKTKEEEK